MMELLNQSKNKKFLIACALAIILVVLGIAAFVIYQHRYATKDFSTKDSKYCAIVRNLKTIASNVPCEEGADNLLAPGTATVVFNYNYRGIKGITDETIYAVDKTSLTIVQEVSSS